MAGGAIKGNPDGDYLSVQELNFPLMHGLDWEILEDSGLLVPRVLSLTTDRRLRTTGSPFKTAEAIAGLNVTLNAGSPGPVTITGLDVSKAYEFSLGFKCDASAAAGDHSVDISVFFASAIGNYHRYVYEFYGYWRYNDDVFNPASTKLVPGKIPPGKTLMGVTLTGNSLSGSESFVFTEWELGLNS